MQNSITRCSAQKRSFPLSLEMNAQCPPCSVATNVMEGFPSTPEFRSEEMGTSGSSCAATMSVGTRIPAGHVQRTASIVIICCVAVAAFRSRDRVIPFAQRPRRKEPLGLISFRKELRFPIHPAPHTVKEVRFIGAVSRLATAGGTGCQKRH